MLPDKEHSDLSRQVNFRTDITLPTLLVFSLDPELTVCCMVTFIVLPTKPTISTKITV